MTLDPSAQRMDILSVLVLLTNGPWGMEEWHFIDFSLNALPSMYGRPVSFYFSLCDNGGTSVPCIASICTHLFSRYAFLWHILLHLIDTFSLTPWDPQWLRLSGRQSSCHLSISLSLSASVSLPLSVCCVCLHVWACTSFLWSFWNWISQLLWFGQQIKANMIQPVLLTESFGFDPYLFAYFIVWMLPIVNHLSWEDGTAKALPGRKCNATWCIILKETLER